MILKGKAINFAEEVEKENVQLEAEGLGVQELTETEQIDFIQIQRSYERDEIFRSFSRLLLLAYAEAVMTTNKKSVQLSMALLTKSIDSAYKSIKILKVVDPGAITKENYHEVINKTFIS